MAQHDNGRRAGGTQSGAWQQGHREHPQDYSSHQQDQSSGGQYGGQQGGHRDAGARGHQDQYESQRGQQGDNWRERQGPAAGGWRPAVSESDRNWNDRGSAYGNQGGQGSFGGQAADNDYGNRGITESGNYGNYGGQRDGNYDRLSGQQRYGQGGSYDQGGQSGQRFGQYRGGYDARSDSTGGYGSANYGPDNNFGSGHYGGGDFNDGSYGSRASGDWQRNPGADRTYGLSSADHYQRGNQSGPSNRDHYGDNGYQGNFTQGQRGQQYHDPDYHQWRNEQLSRLDRDYDEWRQHRYQRFADDFDSWRSNRAQAGSQNGAPSTPGTRGVATGSGPQQSGQVTPGTHGVSTSDTSGQQGGTSKHDVSGGGDKGSGKTASK